MIQLCDITNYMGAYPKRRSCSGHQTNAAITGSRYNQSNHGVTDHARGAIAGQHTRQVVGGQPNRELETMIKLKLTVSQYEDKTDRKSYNSRVIKAKRNSNNHNNNNNNHKSNNSHSSNINSINNNNLNNPHPFGSTRKTSIKQLRCQYNGKVASAQRYKQKMIANFEYDQHMCGRSENKSSTISKNIKRKLFSKAEQYQQSQIHTGHVRSFSTMTIGRHCHENMMGTNFNTFRSKKRNIKIVLRNSQISKSNKHLTLANFFNDKLAMSQNPNLNLRSSQKYTSHYKSRQTDVIDNNKHKNCYCNGKNFFDDIQHSREFVEQYIKHKKNSKTPDPHKQPEEQTNHSYLPQQQKRLYVEIKEYMRKHASHEQFCNYYSAHLATQNQLKSRKETGNISSKKKYDIKNQGNGEDGQAIDGWEENKNGSQFQNCFKRVTSVLRKQNTEQYENQYQTNQIIQFVRKQKQTN